MPDDWALAGLTGGSEAAAGPLYPCSGYRRVDLTTRVALTHVTFPVTQTPFHLSLFFGEIQFVLGVFL